MAQHRRSLDELRERYPQLGFALYAISPGEAVTLEIHAGDELYSFSGPTESAAIEAAFPTPPNVFD